MKAQKSQNRNDAESKNLFSKYLVWRRQRKEKLKQKREKPQTFLEQTLSFVKTVVGAIIVVMIINGLAIASFVVPTPSMEKTVMTGDFLFVNKFIYGPSSPQVVPFLNIPLPFFRLPGYRDPERGDVIVFIFPGERDEVDAREFQYYLKRCIAVAGDTLEVKENAVFVNHQEVPLAPNAHYDPAVPVTSFDQWETFPYGKGFTRSNYGPLRIPKKGDVIPLSIQNLQEWSIFIQREGHKVATNGSAILVDGNPVQNYTVQHNYCFGMGDNRDHSKDSRYWGFVPYENVVGTPIMVYWSWNTDLPLSRIFDKLGSVRWSRIFKFIR